jgi:hypothetical protein
MPDKVRKVSILLQALARIPGLGFLADADYQLRSTADSVDDVGDQIEEGQRHMNDIRSATGDIARSDDE